MQSPGREPSMEEILASIKKVIAEEKELRTAPRPVDAVADEPLPEEVLGATRTCSSSSSSSRRPRTSARRWSTRMSPGRAARRSSSFRRSPPPSPPPPPVNPLEEMVREMLRPILKQWLDENLPQMVEEHVKRGNHADHRAAALDDPPVAAGDGEGNRSAQLVEARMHWPLRQRFALPPPHRLCRQGGASLRLAS